MLFDLMMSPYQTFLKEFEQSIISAKRDISEIEVIAVSKRKSVQEIKLVIDDIYPSCLRYFFTSPLIKLGTIISFILVYVFVGIFIGYPQRKH